MSVNGVELGVGEGSALLDSQSEPEPEDRDVGIGKWIPLNLLGSGCCSIALAVLNTFERRMDTQQVEHCVRVYSRFLRRENIEQITSFVGLSCIALVSLVSVATFISKCCNREKCKKTRKWTIIAGEFGFIATNAICLTINMIQLITNRSNLKNCEGLAKEYNVYDGAEAAVSVVAGVLSALATLLIFKKLSS